MSESFAQYKYPVSFDLMERQAMRPTWRAWLKHILWFSITFITVSIAGMLPPLGNEIPEFNIPEPLNAGHYLLFIVSFPLYYLQLLGLTVFSALANTALLWQGLAFSISLLIILTAHEFGHYIACRLYGVDATLPYFIPMPPLIGPAGTLGAVIRIISPMPSRRAVFDIGVAGPIAGFVAIIPIAVLGVLTQFHNPDITDIQIIFHPPLLLKLLAAGFHVNIIEGLLNPFYFAAWLGLLVTALNLIPVGQLDGGHAVYAVFGQKWHGLIGKLAFATVLTAALTGWFVFSSPSGFLFVILLAVMLRISHPQPMDDAPLDFKRLFVAFLTLVIFVLSFVPIPIEIK
jgi:membrane-associated protease RseP (regulator of RpoE activity)